jgi:hypothetical protein
MPSATLENNIVRKYFIVDYLSVFVLWDNGICDFVFGYNTQIKRQTKTSSSRLQKYPNHKKYPYPLNSTRFGKAKLDKKKNLK